MRHYCLVSHHEVPRSARAVEIGTLVEVIHQHAIDGDVAQMIEKPHMERNQRGNIHNGPTRRIDSNHLNYGYAPD
jgi:hypothetical protein